jgi:MFS family permease
MSSPAAVSGRAAFHIPSFRYFMTARFLTAAANEMQALAVAWEIYAMTRRPLDLGLVGLAQFLPGVLLFLVAGHAADRLRRRNILIACYASFAACSLALLALAAAGIHTVWLIYLVILGNGVVRAFNGPASQSLLPLLVPAEVFANAVAWTSSIFNLAIILGPMIGGHIYGLSASPIPVFAAAVVCNAVAAALVLCVQERSASAPRKAATGDVLLEGLRFIWRRKLVLGAISLDLFAVLLGGAVALLPVYADSILKIGPQGLGILRSGPGIGALATAIVIAYRPLRRRAGAAMLCCVAGFGASTVVFGLSRNIALSMVALVLVGGFDMISVIVRQTMVQLGTPDEMRGRVSAVNMVFIGASNEVGQFESGITAQWFGAVPAVVLGGLGSLAIVLLWSILFPQLRRVDRLTAEELAQAVR